MRQLARTTWARGSLLFAVLVLPIAASAEQVSVAVASNFMKPMAALKDDFERRTDHTLAVSFGSSGRLFAQITNGAPFDVFLSADEAKPTALKSRGLVIAGPKNYAAGRLALWSAGSLVNAMGLKSLENPIVSKIAMANPRLAPYGLAAQQALENEGVYKAVQSKLVMGENIAQAYQFAYSGSAQLGFVALSQVLGTAPKEEYWIVPEELHEPILQSAALLERASNNPAAAEFFEFLFSQEAAAVISRFGYGSSNSVEGAR